MPAQKRAEPKSQGPEETDLADCPNCPDSIEEIQKAVAAKLEKVKALRMERGQYAAGADEDEMALALAKYQFGLVDLIQLVAKLQAFLESETGQTIIDVVKTLIALMQESQYGSEKKRRALSKLESVVKTLEED